MRFRYSYGKIAKLFANSADPDQTPHSAASDLGLNCLPITLLGVSSLQWINNNLSNKGHNLQSATEDILKNKSMFKIMSRKIKQLSS